MFFNLKSSTGSMARDGISSVFVVDTHATRPTVPPRLGKEKKQSGAAQSLLFLLVTLALCGMIIEACLIYRLYQSTYAPSASSLKQTGENSVSPTKNPMDGILPSKPVAHLTDGQDVHHDTHIMSWSMIAEPLLYEMEYKNKQLIIQKEGYYFIYSKVYFSEGGTFYHSVAMQTEKYAGGSITLLQSREYSLKKDKGPHSYSNSYLAGVFHLSENDAIYVNISNTKQIVRHKSYENVFGAYMI
ncbi:tumor necrosis factor ligand superfamily member 14 [Anableps anableps]